MKLSINSSTGQIVPPTSWWSRLTAPSSCQRLEQREILSGSERPVIIGSGACEIDAISACNTDLSHGFNTDGSFTNLRLVFCLPGEAKDSTGVYTKVRIGAVDRETDTRIVEYPIYTPQSQTHEEWMRRGRASLFDCRIVRQELKSDLSGLAHNPPMENCKNADGTENTLITAGIRSKDRIFQNHLVEGLEPLEPSASNPSGGYTRKANTTVFTRRFKVDLTDGLGDDDKSWSIGSGCGLGEAFRQLTKGTKRGVRSMFPTRIHRSSIGLWRKSGGAVSWKEKDGESSCSLETQGTSRSSLYKGLIKP